MPNKILITYATRTQTTEGVANAIGNTLSDAGFQVDIYNLNEVKNIESYQTIIVGSAIQAGKWLPEAIEFIKNHQVALQKVKFATFTVCMTLAMRNGEKYRFHVESWLKPVRDMAEPISEGFFTGALNVSAIKSFGDRLKFRISVLLGVWKEGDHRNWEAIKTWALNLVPMLLK